MEHDKLVNPFLPAITATRYKRNFLRQVVCELRFPTLFDLNTSTPNLEFAASLRQDYPHHSHQVTETAVNGDSFDRVHTHLFKSRNLEWTVTCRPSAITIETTRYVCFPDLTGRVNTLIELASKFIDTSFFTRVGLRYINAVPMDVDKESGNTDKFKGWVRDSLTSVLVNDDLGVVHEYSGRISGTTQFGMYLFQHGVGYDSNKSLEYVIDLDFSRENVELNDTISALDELHQNQFSMFHWSLGPLALEYLAN